MSYFVSNIGRTGGLKSVGDGAGDVKMAGSVAERDVPMADPTTEGASEVPSQSTGPSNLPGVRGTELYSIQL